MRINKVRFTIIELVTASTLTLIMFMMIGYVFSSVSDITATLNDKITEGLQANKFFSQLADDVESSFPVFHLGEGSDGAYLKVSEPAAGSPLGPLLPTGNTVANMVSGSKTYNVGHSEFLRCVATNHLNGGLLSSTGFESMNVSDNIDQNDKPVRFVSYNFTGTNEVIGGHPPRSIYRRDFPLRPDLRKGDTTVRGGYSVGAFVKVGLPNDGETAAASRADGDINESLYLEGVWEIRVEFLETPQNTVISGFGNKVLVRVTIEFGMTDDSKPYSDVTRFSQYSNVDLNPVNGMNDRLEHTYTTVIVINRSNWEQ
jgi:hypothetical protein